MRASTSTPVTSSSNASSRWYGAHSAGGAGGSRRLRRLVELPAATGSRCWFGHGRCGHEAAPGIDTGRHDTIGIDLVAMCANDVVVQGAEPLFFLDYYATGKLQVEVAEAVVRGIVEGCVQAGAALVGGETAEMPGMYQGEDYDLAGFCVGVVEKAAIIDGSRVAPAMPSSASIPPDRTPTATRSSASSSPWRMPDRRTLLEGRSLFDRLLAPTRIYVKPLLALLRALPVHGLAHITGGGLTDNIPRVLPEGTEAVLTRRAGSATRCSTGCSTSRGSILPTCTAPSTAASAWWSIVPADAGAGGGRSS